MNIKRIIHQVTILFLLITVISTASVQAGSKAEAGKQLFDKVITAMGGAARIAEIKNTMHVMEVVRYTSEGNFTMNAASIAEYPDKIWYTVRSRRGQVLMCVDGKEGWQQLPPKPLEKMPEKDRQVEMGMMLRDPFYVQKYIEKYSFEKQPDQTVAGKKALDLLIKGPATFHLLIDPATHLPVGTRFKDQTAITENPVEQNILFFDYKDIEGIKVALKTEIHLQGKKIMEGSSKEVRFNVETGKDFFTGKADYSRLLPQTK